jgi:hypothetical protein
MDAEDEMMDATAEPAPTDTLKDERSGQGGGRPGAKAVEGFEARGMLLKEEEAPRGRQSFARQEVKADQLLVIETDEPDRVRDALVRLADQEVEKRKYTGFTQADDRSYYMAVPTDRYEAVLKRLALLNPAQETQELKNLDGPDLEVVRRAPAWHDGYRLGLRAAAQAYGRQRSARRAEDAGKPMLGAEMEEAATAEEGAESDAAAQGASGHRDDEDGADGADEAAFVTILVRILPSGKAAIDAQVDLEETESAPAAEEPAE